MENKITTQIDVLQTISKEDLYQQIQLWYQHIFFERKLSANTVYNYLLDLKSFLLFLSHHTGSKPGLSQFAKLSVNDIRAYLAAQTLDQKAKRSNARALSSLKTFTHFLKTKGIQVSNHFQAISTPRLSKLLPKPLLKDQVETLVQYHPQNWKECRDEALFILLYGCGLRISEALQLNWLNLPPLASQSQPLVIKGKGSKERVVMLLPLVLEKIYKYREICPFTLQSHDPVFLGARRERLHPAVAQRALRILRRKLGLPETLTPHTLRHSFASHLIERGGDVRHVQELLGHSSLSTTQIYTLLSTEKLLSTYQQNHPRDKSKSN